MVEPIADTPPGVLGFRAHGELTREDNRDVLLPALREAVEAGSVRMLLVVAEDFKRLDFGAKFADAKADVKFGLEQRDAWERVALVTDAGWMRKGFQLFGWMAPGEVRLFRGGEEAAARKWVAG